MSAINNNDICTGNIKQINLSTQKIYIFTICVFNDLVICGSISKIYIQNIYSGELIRVLNGHKSNIYSICVKDNLIISASNDRTIRIWDITKPVNKECIYVLEGHEGSVNQVCIKDNQIISGSTDLTIRIWDLDIIMTNYIHNLESSSDSDSDNNSNSNSNSDSNSSCVGNECIRILDGHLHTVTSICIKDNLIISGANDKTIHVLDMTRPIGQECIQILHGHTYAISLIYCMPGNIIISCSWDYTIRIWDLSCSKGYECISVLTLGYIYINSICVINNLLIAKFDNNEIRIYDLAKIICKREHKSYRKKQDMCMTYNSYDYDSQKHIRLLYTDTNYICGACIIDNLIIHGSGKLIITPVTLFQGEYELFQGVINTYLTYLIAPNIVDEIWQLLNVPLSKPDLTSLYKSYIS